MVLYNFPVLPGGPVSARFLEKGIADFASACVYIQHLPYRRNTSRTNPFIVLEEQCGTCSTKHAILALLARENNRREVRLMLGIFKMMASNTPPVAGVLQRHGLVYLPEAHNYLRIHDQLLDVTMPGHSPDFIPDLLEESEMSPGETGEDKINYHKKILAQWLVKEKIPYDLTLIWQIREQCIAALSA